MNNDFWAEFLIPYSLSNIFAIGLAAFSWRRPNKARFGYAFLFVTASVLNSRMAVVNPQDYLNYSQWAWWPYNEFINGPFADIVTPMVLFIAICQLAIGVGFLFRGKILKLACIGAATFLAAIIPLGLGSAFPFSIFAITGLAFIYPKSAMTLLA